MNKNTIAALDIGSSKVCCIIAHVMKDKRLKIVGYGYNASNGIKNGVITDINQATISVCNAVEDAEQKANERIDSHLADIHVIDNDIKYIVEVKNKKQITIDDINKLLNKGKSKINASGNNEIIHCSATTYKVDHGEDVKDPMNIYGEELSVNILLGMYPSNLYRNLASVVEAAHLEIENKVFTAYASGLACMVEDERKYGATIVDIGGGTTSIATFKNGFPIAFSTIPVGGINITRDITQGLTTSFAHAEDLKIRSGCAFGVSQDEYENINVYPLGEEDDSSIRQMHRSDLIKIIAPRVEEIFELINKKLDLHGLRGNQNHRVVLTGGCSQLPGIRAVANLILDKQPLHDGRAEKTLAISAKTGELGMLLFEVNINNMERKPKKMVNHTIGEQGRIAKIFNWLKQNS